MPKRWEVVGGVESGGILVRESQSLSSNAEVARLSTGAVVDEICLDGDRLQYRLFLGTGPETGWVSIKIAKKELLIKKPFDPYKVLNVSPDAPNAVIKSAFRKASLKVHPDQNQSPDAAALFRQLTEARDFLLSPTKRLLYNIKHGLQQKIPTDKWWETSDWDALFEELSYGLDDVGQLLAESALAQHVDNRIDIMILGATGLTGMLTCKLLQQWAPKYTFGIAGRNQRKLDLLETAFGKGPLFRGAFCITDQDAIEGIARRARVLIDATGTKVEMDVGLVARACVLAGTHLIDVGGFRGDILVRAEPSFRERIDEEAKAAGVTLAFFCGWCAAAGDVGVWKTVQYLREVYGLPTARMVGYEHFHNFPMGGTLEKSFSGNGNLEKDEERLGAFMLGGERPGGIRAGDLMKNETVFSEDYGVWTCPQVFPERVVVRGSCGMLDGIEPYGDNFQFRNFQVHGDKFSADKSLVGRLIMARNYQQALAAEKIPPPGTGPKERMRDEAVVIRVFVAEADEEVDEDTSTPRKVYSIMRMGPGGAGDPYEGSALSMLAGACCLLDALDTGKNLHYGFGTPVYHFAHIGYAERMEEAGFKAELHTGDLPKDLLKNLMGAERVEALDE